MDIWQVIVLAIVEGITEYLPISSTGHLTIAEKLMGLPIDDPSVTAFTAVIQIGAILAVLVYFAKDIIRLSSAWGRGLVSAEARRVPDYKMAWMVIAGSLPILFVGYFGQDIIKGPLRSMWFVAGSLIVWSGVMAFAEYAATHKRTERDLNLKDTIIIGLAQCLALVPGVSRSGATITAGLLRDLDRVTATRLAFFLGVPALVAAGIFELPDALDKIPLTTLVIGNILSFLVAYASIAWLLRFVASHTMMSFVWYRVGLGLVIIGLLLTNTITAT